MSSSVEEGIVLWGSRNNNFPFSAPQVVCVFFFIFFFLFWLSADICFLYPACCVVMLAGCKKPSRLAGSWLFVASAYIRRRAPTLVSVDKGKRL